MDCSTKLLLSLLLVCSFSVIMSSRDLNPNPNPKPLNLFEEQGNRSCLDSLFQLHSCTSEIVLFFLNGETYLGPSCCNAIKTIQHHCLPSTLGSVGIDQEEGLVLLGYCDAADFAPHMTPPLQAASTPITNITSFHVINPLLGN